MEPAPYQQPPALYSGAQNTGNLGLGIAAGLGAALVGAVLWAVIAAATHLKVGFVAVGVGYLVGLAVRKAGNGHNATFGIVGLVLALLGCVVGDILRDCALVAEYTHQSISTVLGSLDPAQALRYLEIGFQPLDAVFYLIAASAGYRNSFVKS